MYLLASPPGLPFNATMPTLRLTPRYLNPLLLTFAVVAAILWLLPLATSRPILFPSGPSFEDVLVYKGRFTVYHSARFFTSRAFSAFAYPAGAAPIYEAIYKTPDPVLTYQLLAALTTLAALAAAWTFLRRRNATRLFPPLLLLSFPLVFLIQRANIEIVLWIVIALGILSYRRGLGILAAVLFGIAAAVKLYPIFLLGLFLKRRRELPLFAIGIIVFLVTMSAAIAHAGPTFSVAANGFFNGVSHFQDHYVDTVSRTELAFDHCLFSPFKYLAFTNHVSPAPWRHTYYIVAGLLALLLFLRVRTFPFLNRILFLITAMVSLPPVSFNYTLVHLYVPLFLLLGALLTLRTRPPATAFVAFMLLLFLMLPLGSLSVFTSIPTGPMQSCALLALILTCALIPWHLDSVADGKG
jgi:hypothetical protein